MRKPISLPARVVALLIALTILNGCTALLWKDHDWDDDCGKTTARVALTPFTIALDAAGLFAVTYALAHIADDDDDDCGCWNHDHHDC